MDIYQAGLISQLPVENWHARNPYKDVDVRIKTYRICKKSIQVTVTSFAQICHKSHQIFKTWTKFDKTRNFLKETS